MAELKQDEFDFTRLSNRIAARDAEFPAAQLVADLRAQRLHEWQPPGGGPEGALNHAVVHGLDVTVPLGAQRRCSDDAIRLVLDQLTVGGVHGHFGTDISGRRFEATDIPWSFGRGETFRAPSERIALQICGRQLPS